jgi:site-specific DNA-methyltransferase (cytosine-N4-specific)
LDGAAAAGDSEFAPAPGGRNPGDVWFGPTAKFPQAHFAVMPDWLAQRCVLAGCRPGGTVLDPFAGSCTTGMVANRAGRAFVGIDLRADYLDLALRTRLAQGALLEEVPTGA